MLDRTLCRAAVLSFYWALAPGGLLAAQTEGSIAAGVGTVRTSDGSSVGALTVSPGIRHTTPATLVDARASVAALLDGDVNLQLMFDAWRRLGPSRDGIGLAVAATLGGSAFPGTARAGFGQLLLELRHTGRGGGGALGAGPVVGAIGGADPATGVRVRGRAWLDPGPLHPAAGVESTRLQGQWYADAFLNATWMRGPVTATIAATWRIDERDATRTAASAFVSWQVSHRAALQGSVGGFPADPLLGFERATAASVGARVALGRRANRGAAPLLARSRGEALVVQVRVRDAMSVAVAGDWTGWATVPLRRVRPGSEIWELVVALAPGTYRFNLVVDGTRWTLPDGVASVPDGLGGRVGLLVVAAPRHGGVR